MLLKALLETWDYSGLLRLLRPLLADLQPQTLRNLNNSGSKNPDKFSSLYQNLEICLTWNVKLVKVWSELATLPAPVYVGS